MRPVFSVSNRLTNDGKQHAVDAFMAGRRDIADIASHFNVSRKHVEQAIREAIMGLVALVPKKTEKTADDSLVLSTEGDALHG